MARFALVALLAVAAVVAAAPAYPRVDPNAEGEHYAVIVAGVCLRLAWTRASAMEKREAKREEGEGTQAHRDLHPTGHLQ